MPVAPKVMLSPELADAATVKSAAPYVLLAKALKVIVWATLLTVILSVAVRLPSSVITVIMADPWAMAVTKPEALTAAAAVLFDLQVTT